MPCSSPRGEVGVDWAQLKLTDALDLENCGVFKRWSLLIGARQWQGVCTWRVVRISKYYNNMKTCNYMRRKKGIILSLYMLKSLLDILVNLQLQGKIIRENWSTTRIGPLFRRVTLDRPTLTIPFPKCFIIFSLTFVKSNQKFGLYLNGICFDLVGNFASAEQCYYLFTWISPLVSDQLVWQNRKHPDGLNACIRDLNNVTAHTV